MGVELVELFELIFSSEEGGEGDKGVRWRASKPSSPFVSDLLVNRISYRVGVSRSESGSGSESDSGSGSE